MSKFLSKYKEQKLEELLSIDSTRQEETVEDENEMFTTVILGLNKEFSPVVAWLKIAKKEGFLTLFKSETKNLLTSYLQDLDAFGDKIDEEEKIKQLKFFTLCVIYLNYYSIPNLLKNKKEISKPIVEKSVLTLIAYKLFNESEDLLIKELSLKYKPIILQTSLFNINSDERLTKITPYKLIRELNHSRNTSFYKKLENAIEEYIESENYKTIRDYESIFIEFNIENNILKPRLTNLIPVNTYMELNLSNYFLNLIKKDNLDPLEDIIEGLKEEQFQDLRNNIVFNEKLSKKTEEENLKPEKKNIKTLNITENDLDLNTIIEMNLKSPTEQLLFKDFLEEKTKVKTNWKKTISKIIEHDLKEESFSFSPPFKNLRPLGIMSPTKTTKEKQNSITKLNIYIDNSASIDKEEMKLAIANMRKLAKTYETNLTVKLFSSRVLELRLNKKGDIINPEIFKESMSTNISSVVKDINLMKRTNINETLNIIISDGIFEWKAINNIKKGNRLILGIFDSSEFPNIIDKYNKVNKKSKIRLIKLEKD